MKKPVGPLGWTAEERDAFDRTGKWPTRTVEAPKWRPGLRPGPPSPDFLRGYFAALRQPGRKGAKSKLDEHLELTIECLRDAEHRAEDARKLYVARSPVTKDAASRQFSRALKILQTLWRSD